MIHRKTSAIHRIYADAADELLKATPESEIGRRKLLSAMRYIGAYYGGTKAHHILALALKEVECATAPESKEEAGQ